MSNKYDFYDLEKVEELAGRPETIEMGGYYWDPTDLPPKDYLDEQVPLQFKNIGKWMRSKMNGLQTRETMARLAEMVGINTHRAVDVAERTQIRQDAVEQYNNQMITEMTDKDVISAPEIIQMRGGEATANDRLNRIEYREYMQFYIENPSRLPSGTEIVLKGFYYGSDDGRTSKYTISNLDGQEVIHEIVTDSLTYRITENLEIIIGSKKLIPRFKQRLHGRYIGLGSNDDTEVFELLMDYAYKNNKHVDLSNIEVTILGTVMLNKPQYPRDLLIVFDGIIKKPNAGLMFDTAIRNMTGGGYKWLNTKFVGIERETLSLSKTEADNAPEMALFDTAIIRNYFTNTEFVNVDKLLDSKANEFFAQTVYLNNPHVVGGVGTFIETFNAYDISVSKGLIEHRWNFMDIKTPHSVRVIDNVIEGMNGFVYKGYFGRGLQIKDNYFESNCQKTDEPYFNFENGLATLIRSFTFTGNLIQDNPDRMTRPDDYAIVKFDTPPEAFELGGNWCDIRLYSVAQTQYLTNKLLRNVMTNQINDNNYPVLNNWRVRDVLEGSGGRLKYNIDSLASDFVGSGGASVRKIGQGVEITLPQNGKVVTSAGFAVAQSQQIVLGASVFKVQSVTGSLVFKIQKYDSTEVEIYRLPFDKIDSKFYSMPPIMHVGVPDNYKLVISAEGNTSNMVFIINSLVAQLGTIANMS